MDESRPVLARTLTILGFFGVFVLLVTQFQSDYNRKLEAQYGRSLRTLESEQKSVLLGYKRDAEIITSEVLLTDEIARAFYRAYRAADLESREALKAEFERLVSPLFGTLNKYSFEQLQFRFDDKTVFFQMPGEEHLFHGYTFGFPLEIQAELTGSVHLRIAYGEIVDDLEELFEKKYQIIIPRENVEALESNRRSGQYAEWWIDSSFFPDNRTPGPGILYDITGKEGEALLKSKISPRVKEGRSFADSFRWGSDYYLVAFLPFEGDDGEIEAYLISVEQSEILRKLEQDFTLILILATFAVAAFILLFVFLFNRVV